MDEKLNSKDKVLLMRDEGEGNKLKVVKGMGKRGKIDAVDPMKANSNDFLLIDRHANPIENFFKNFFNQAKNPSHTGFYVVSVEMLHKVLTLGENQLEKFRVNPKDYIKEDQTQDEVQSEKNTKTEKNKNEEKTENQKEENMETKNKAAEQKTNYEPLDVSRIPESEYQKYGIKPEDLAAELKAMSYGFKSPHLIEINPTIEGVEYPSQARLSLEEQADGSLKFMAHPYQQQVDLDKPFHGVMLSDDVKENLLKTGHAGMMVELNPKGEGNPVPSLVSIDKLTNRLEAVPLDKLNLSQSLKGTELSVEQQQDLKEGKKVLVEGMTSKKTIGTDNPQKFDAYIQFNAARGSYDFSYDGLDRNKYRQDNKQEEVQSEQQQNTVRIPNNLLGVDLNEKQQNLLREGKTTYVQGMVKDGQGEPFNAYVKVNNEKGKLDFFRWNPDKAKKQGAQVKPANESKTQVAVNSEGKTSEATKHVKEPLKQGQQKPTESQDKQQKQRTRKPAKKSAGQKM